MKARPELLREISAYPAPLAAVSGPASDDRDLHSEF
jgi:hypothetical protein